MSFRRAMKGGTCRRPFGLAFFSFLASVGETQEGERERQSKKNTKKKKGDVRQWPDHRPIPPMSSGHWQCCLNVVKLVASWLLWSSQLPLEF